jgi:uncharacterized protein (TIGR01244 family)
MDIRPLSEDFAVAPQIDPQDLAAIKAAGFTTLVNNRPDNEVQHDLQSAAMRAAAEAAGLKYIDNPLSHGSLSMEHVRAQGEALDTSDGPVLAYCASGNRSSILWALSQAGKIPTDDLVSSAARVGYNLEPVRDEIDRLARART